MAHVSVGDRAEAALMGYRDPIVGRVQSVTRGISVSNAAPSTQGLPNVDPVYTWVRLAQRVPVRNPPHAQTRRTCQFRRAQPRPRARHEQVTPNAVSRDCLTTVARSGLEPGVSPRGAALQIRQSQLHGRDAFRHKSEPKTAITDKTFLVLYVTHKQGAARFSYSYQIKTRWLTCGTISPKSERFSPGFARVSR